MDAILHSFSTKYKIHNAMYPANSFEAVKIIKTSIKYGLNIMKSDFRLNLLNYFLRPLLIVIISGIIGYLLLVLVYCLPTKTMKEHMLSGARIYLTETLEYEYAEGYKSSILDNETDGIMLSETVYSSGNPVDDAVFVPRYVYPSAEGSIYSLLGILQEDESSDPFVTTYSYYWHGYLVLLKPFYLFFDFADMRMFNLTGVLCVMFLLIALLYKVHRQQFMLPLLVMMVYWNPATISMCIQLSDCYYISMLASCFILYYCEKYKISDNFKLNMKEEANDVKNSRKEKIRVESNRFNMNVILIFLIIGILTVYFDFLTYPIVTLCVPLTFCLLCTFGEKLWDSCKRVILCSTYWAVGYIGMWVMKWTIGTIVTGQNLFTNASAKLIERSGTEVEGEAISRIETVLILLKTYIKWPYLILTIIVLVLLFFLSRRCFPGKNSIVTILQRIHTAACILTPYLLIALIPLAWIFITANHCYVHPRLTYRDIGASMFSVLCGIFSYNFKQQTPAACCKMDVHS